MSRLRAAIVGTGYVARVHLGVLRALGVDVVALCGSRPGRADALAADVGATPYHDLGELLRSERIDALHVCTPNALHAEQALAGLGHGVHVVCEKPLAVSTDESARMLDAAERSGLVGATCYHVRGYPLVARMRAEVGTLGDLRAVHGRYFCDDALQPAAGGWRVDPALSGPSYVTADLGAHWLDLAEHVTGLAVEAVQASFRGEPLEEWADLRLRLTGGAVGSLLLSALAAGRKNQLLFEVEGAHGGFTWDQERPDELLRRHAQEPTQTILKDGPLARFPPGHGEGYGQAFENVLANAYRAIAGEPHEAFPTFADGHRGVAVLEAAVASARAGDWVALRG